VIKRRSSTSPGDSANGHIGVGDLLVSARRVVDTNNTSGRRGLVTGFPAGKVDTPGSGNGLTDFEELVVNASVASEGAEIASNSLVVTSVVVGAAANGVEEADLNQVIGAWVAVSSSEDERTAADVVDEGARAVARVEVASHGDDTANFGLPVGASPLAIANALVKVGAGNGAGTGSGNTAGSASVRRLNANSVDVASAGAFGLSITESSGHNIEGELGRSAVLDVESLEVFNGDLVALDVAGLESTSVPLGLVSPWTSDFVFRNQIDGSTFGEIKFREEESHGEGILHVVGEGVDNAGLGDGLGSFLEEVNGDIVDLGEFVDLGQVGDLVSTAQVRYYWKQERRLPSNGGFEVHRREDTNGSLDARIVGRAISIELMRHLSGNQAQQR